MMTTVNNLDLFLSHIRYAAAIFDTHKKLIHLSPKFEILFGIPSDDAAMLKLETIFDQNPFLLEQIQKVYETKSRFYMREVKVVVDDKEELFDAELFPLTDVEDRFFGMAVCLFTIEEDSIFVEQKKRHDSLSRLNLIASGLAHEIKNPLSGIKGATQLLSAEVKDNSNLKEYADIILEETERVDRLVKELLNFTKPKELRLKKININKLLHSLLMMLQVSTKKSINWVEDFDPSLPKVSADEDALKQVFLNLLQNAVDAVNSDGVIRISSKIVTDFMLKTGHKKRQIVRVNIIDNGCGIDELAQKNIFTPFYTTKAHGTGLGLAIANQLVELHGGSVMVKSEANKGTDFSVFVPV